MIVINDTSPLISLAAVGQSVRVRKWKRLFEHGSEVAVHANGEVVPAHQLREAERRIRDWERALGRKTMEVEILQAAQEEVKKRPSWYGVSRSRPVTP